MTPIETTEEVLLPDAPGIPGLRFRRFRDASDWAALAELQRLAAIADQDDEIPSAENLRIELENRPAFVIARDLLIAEVDGQLVGEANGTATIRGEGYPVHMLWGRVHPDWRRRGIGRALFRWNERRARDRAAAEPELGGPTAVIGGFATEFEPGYEALFESEGYRPFRYAFTMINRHVQVAEPIPMPSGLEIRPVTPDQHRTIFAADDEAFLDHFEHRPATEADFIATFSQPDLDTSLWKIGWDGDQVAGGIMTTIWNSENEALGVNRAWLESVFTRRPWRRRGLARALIGATLVELRERGIEEAMLGVDAENPTGALALYEGLGFEVKVRTKRYRKPLES
jgi:ribosomal protein S18 acetylase RimI-like enzyme